MGDGHLTPRDSDIVARTGRPVLDRAAIDAMAAVARTPVNGMLLANGCIT